MKRIVPFTLLLLSMGITSCKQKYAQGFSDGAASRDGDVVAAYNDGYDDGSDDAWEAAEAFFANATYSQGYTDGVASQQGAINSAFSNGETQGYNNGYSDGAGDGYDLGYGDGLADGYDLGYDDGFLDGGAGSGGGATQQQLNTAYNNGFSDGETQGYNNGYDDGYGDGTANGGNATQAQLNAAYDNGYDDGYGDGLDDGLANSAAAIADAYDDGYSDGYTDGDIDGYDAGINTGYALGAQDGYDLGFDDGYDFGFDDGYSFGLDDGYDIGYDDGYYDGYWGLSTDKNKTATNVLGLPHNNAKNMNAKVNLANLLANDLVDFKEMAKAESKLMNDIETGVVVLEETAQGTKDIQKLAALKEQFRLQTASSQIKAKFGLSTESSLRIAKLSHSFRKLSSTKAVTEKDSEAFSKELIGADMKEIEGAYKSAAKGEFSNLKGLVEKAAMANKTSPEKMAEVMFELFI